MAPVKFFKSVCALGLVVSSTCLGQENSFSAGPLYDEFPLTLSAGYREEAVGPFFSRQRADPERSISLPPFYYCARDQDIDSTEMTSLYPILTYERYGREYRWQFFQLFSFAGGQTQEEIPRKRFTLFPIYFQQRSVEPEFNYTAVFPVYGHLQNRLFRDDIRFVMFPFYSKTRKKDVVTENYLFPVFHWRHGNEVNGWQAWPLIGKEHKGITWRTNSLDELETIGGYDKNFVLWPFYFHDRTALGTDNPEERRVLVPFISSYHSPKRDSVSYGWPFGYTITDDRDKKYHEKDLFWPLFVKADGEGKTVRRIWPLFSRARNEFLESNWYLWPVYKVNRLKSPPLDRRRTRIMFILWSDLSEKNLEAKTELRRIDQWPLFTTRRDREGNQRTQVLALLEPLLPNAKGVERNWAPLYSLWRAEKNGKTGANSQSLLWNLYRRDATPQTKKISFLFGLFQYQSTPEGKRWRVGYIPFGKKNAPENTLKSTQP